MTSLPPSLPPFAARPTLVADLAPLVGLLTRTLGIDRLWIVVSKEDLESLGGEGCTELELLAGSTLVCTGSIVEALARISPVSEGPCWSAGGRLFVRVGEGGLVSGAATLRSRETLAVAGPLAAVACTIVSRAAEYGRAQAKIRELAELSTVDPLTGLRNRRYFDRRFASEIARRRRYLRALTLLIFDLDHFKHLNDSYGHDVGDIVLQAVARAIREQLRSVDVAVRLGGEEFAALLPETPIESGVFVAERIRRAIASLDMDGVRVTVSVGIATVEGRWDGDGPALLRAADQALYAAKREGRNRVVHVNLGEGSIDSTPR